VKLSVFITQINISSVLQSALFQAQNVSKSMAAGASPQTHLQHSPDSMQLDLRGRTPGRDEEGR